MLPNQFVMVKFCEFMEASLEGRPDASEVLKKLRHFNNHFMQLGSDPIKAMEYFRQDCQIVDIPLQIQESLHLQSKQMLRTGPNLGGLYKAFLIGMILRQGSIKKEGFKSLNFVIQQCQEKTLEGIIEYASQANGLHSFKDLCVTLMKNTQNMNLVNHLLENGIITASHSIDINRLSLGQSAQLIDQLNSVMDVEIKQILYYKPNPNFHRLVLVNCKNEQRTFQVFVENDSDMLQYYLLHDEGIRTKIKQLLEELTSNTELLVERGQLQTINEYQAATRAQKMGQLILEKRKKCLICQQEFFADMHSIAGQISHFCSKCYSEFQT